MEETSSSAAAAATAARRGFGTSGTGPPAAAAAGPLSEWHRVEHGGALDDIDPETGLIVPPSRPDAGRFSGSERRLDGSYVCTHCGGSSGTPLRAHHFVLVSRLALVDERLGKGTFCTAECLLGTAYRVLGASSALCGEIDLAVRRAMQRAIVPAPDMLVYRLAFPNSVAAQRCAMLDHVRASLNDDDRRRATDEDARHIPLSKQIMVALNFADLMEFDAEAQAAMPRKRIRESPPRTPPAIPVEDASVVEMS